MKKIVVMSVSSLLLFSSCGTYTGSGAYTGGTFGSIIGSAIGGIAGGPRGSDIGTLIGMAGGAAVGAAVGAAADNAQQQRYEEYQAAREQRRGAVARPQTDSQQSVRQPEYDASGSGDDRLYGFDEAFNTTADRPSDRLPDLEIRNPRLLDASRDGELSRGEEARMVFEIYNNSSQPAFRVLPTVMEVTGNKHIRVSENVLVESIMPGKGIRYTATIKTDTRLKDGEAVFRIGVMQRNRDIPSQAREFRIKTNKR